MNADKRFAQLDVGSVWDRMAELALSVEDLARAAGVDVSTLSRWLNGAQRIRHRNVGSLARALGCEVGDLVSGEEKPPHAGRSSQPLVRDTRSRFLGNLERWLDKAIVEQLGGIHPASGGALDSALRDVTRHDAFRAHPPRAIPAREAVALSELQLVGAPDPTLSRRLRGPRPLRVLIPISSTAALALFRFLSIVRGAEIETDYWNVGGADVVDKLLNPALGPRADLFVLGAAPAAHLLRLEGKPPFQAIAALPAVRTCVVAPARLRDQRDWNILKRGEYLIRPDEGVNQLWRYLSVVNGDRNSPAATVVPTPLSAVPKAFQSEEKTLRSVLWSPLAEILRGLGVARILEEPGYNPVPQLLFAGDDVPSECVRALCAALMDARKSLYIADYRAGVVRSLMEDALFVETFERSTGIDALYT